MVNYNISQINSIFWILKIKKKPKYGFCISNLFHENNFKRYLSNHQKIDFVTK